MAKKPIVEVDEDILRSAMLGDVPAMRREAEPQAVLSSQESEKLEQSLPKRGSYRKRRKEDDDGYRSFFFVNDGEKVRVSTHVNRDLHEKMKRMLSVVAPDVTLVSYINNILRHHLEEYQDNLNEMYRKEIEKTLMQ